MDLDCGEVKMMNSNDVQELKEKREELKVLKELIKVLYYKSLNQECCELQTEKLSEQYLQSNDYCTNPPNLKDAETQTFESDFLTQDSSFAESTQSALDWVTESGSKVTISDLVQEVVQNQPEQQNDYVYDDNFKMYYSPSTGYYYDTERNLLYEPYSQTYYRYDSVQNKYELYYEHKPENSDIVVNENCDSELIESSPNLKGKNKSQNKTRKKTFTKKNLKSGKLLGKQNAEKNEMDNVSDSSSTEEGEIRSDWATSSSENEESSHFSRAHDKDGSSEKWPPCIRAVVKEPNNEKIGHLILIPCTGGTIGREKGSCIYIPDISLSREHADIQFDNESWQYGIKDLHSQNGTFVNDTKLLPESKEHHPLNHGDILRLGSCKLLIHIHDGTNTCKDCEPGIIQAELDAQQEIKIKEIIKSREDSETIRRNNLKQLKKKFGLKGMNFVSASLPDNYKDRSERRRKEVGSQNPYEKDEIPVSIDTALPSSNKGYTMLKNMGWSEGESLGANNSGITEPINIHFQCGTTGLGSSSGLKEAELRGDATNIKWKKAQKRYYAIQEKSKCDES